MVFNNKNSQCIVVLICFLPVEVARCDDNSKNCANNSCAHCYDNQRGGRLYSRP